MDMIWILSVIVVPLALILLGTLALRRYKMRSFIQVNFGAMHLLLILLSVRLGLHFGNVGIEQLWVQCLRGLMYFTSCWLAIKFIEHILFEHEGQGAERGKRFSIFFREIIRFLVLTMVIIVLLKVVFKVDPSAIVVTSTVMSAIIGLALQDMLANIVAGVALQIERPFQEGHWVRVGDRNGRVLHMSWRTTRLKTRDGDVLFIPNSALTQQEILNYYQPDRLHLVRKLIGTSYNDAPDHVKQALITSLNNTAGVLDQPPVSIHLASYDDFSITYEMRFWIADYEAEPTIVDQVMSRLWYVFQREGITIPYPISEIHHERRSMSGQRRKEQRLAAEAAAQERMSKVGLFQSLTQEQRIALTHEAQFRQYGCGEYLVHQGADDANLFLIEKGQVSVLVQRNEGEPDAEVGSFGPGFYFGEYALLTGEKRSASVIARSHVEAMVISKETVEPLLPDNPKLSDYISSVLKRRAEELERLKQDEPKSEPTPEQNATLLTRFQRFFNL